MTYVTNAERFGFERGIQEGRQEGRQEGKSALILHQLTHRIGVIAPQAETQIRSLSVSQLESLGEALLDFSKPEDLIKWLQTLDA